MNPKDFTYRLAVLSSSKGVLKVFMSEITSTGSLRDIGNLILCSGMTDMKGQWLFFKDGETLSMSESVIIFEPEKKDPVEKEKSENWQRYDAVMVEILNIFKNEERLDKDQIFTNLVKTEKVTKEDFEIVSKSIRILRDKRKLRMLKRGSRYFYFI